MKKIKNIPFVEIESIPVLIKDFLRQDISGFEDKFLNNKNLALQIELKKKSYPQAQRENLTGVLKDQYSDFNLSEKQFQNLTKLQADNTFTVTTGHQLNLFTGPAFFIYKILQTIKLAEVLKHQFPTHYFVPLFWMASEDHDFAEINHFRTVENYYETKGNSGGAVGRIKVEDLFFITQFENEFKDSVFGTELILLLKKAYQIGNTFTQATQIIVHELFADYGLLVIDGDDARLKKDMTSLFKEELLHQQVYAKAENMVALLTEKYGKVQVNPREINLFYLTETRNRISFEDDQFVIIDSDVVFSAEEILAELENHPERFSPNALLRPVFQEKILPNLAYIGGNAEIMYWLELKDYFQHINLPFPLLVPRNSILMLEEKTLNKIEKFKLDISDFFKNFAAVTKDLVMQGNEIAPYLREQEKALQHQFLGLKKRAELTDKTFFNLVEAEETRQLKSFGRMKKRLLRAEKIKQEEKLDQLQLLFSTVHPGNTWQERIYNFSVFYADLGPAWLYTCYEEIVVEKSELIIFTI